MPAEVVIVGIGEMGGVLARGLLRDGCTVHPVTRELDPADAAARVPSPERVVVAVGEEDLERVLAVLPLPWRDRAVLLQNELLPASWERHRIADPTVLVAWFEKKPGKDVTVILPSPVAGPGAARIAGALARVGIAARTIETGEELLVELVRKNLYILVANLAGLALEATITVGELWRDHRAVAVDVARDVLALQEALAGAPLPAGRLLAGLEEAIAADPAHRARGRSAPARLRRALAHAREHGIAVPALERLPR